MTIALGLLAQDGIVLAADTEMTWGEYLKTDGTKVSALENDGFAIAGAGDGDYLDAIAYELMRAFKGLATDDFVRIERELQSVLAKFHRQHVTPWKDPGLDFMLLIAHQRKGKRALWATKKATIRPCVYSAIGIGGADAHSLLSQFFEGERYPLIDRPMARLIAAYVVYLVKDRVRGCGKNTDMVEVTDSKAEVLSRSNVNLLEHYVARFMELQTRAAQFAFGYILTNDVQAQAQHLANFFLGMRTEYEETAGFRSSSQSWTLGTKPPGQASAIMQSSQSTEIATKRGSRGSTRNRKDRLP